MQNSLQKKFWTGEFGDRYVERNDGPVLVASNIALFSKILQRTHKIDSVCELGANIGLNLVSLHQPLPQAMLTSVEINEKAAERLAPLPYVNAIHSSIYDELFCCESECLPQYDFVYHRDSQLPVEMISHDS